MQTFFVQKKTVIIEIVVLILFLFGIYYLYTIMSEGEVTTTSSQISEQLLGKNFVLFIKAVNQDKLSFREADFMNSDLVQRLRDFSETILPTETRGRVDPFVPYASTRSLR